MTSLVDARRAVNTVYLAFDIVTHKILTDKLLMYRLGEQTVRWLENGMKVWIQSMVISSTKSRWRPEPVVYPRDQYWDQSCLTSSLVI